MSDNRNILTLDLATVTGWALGRPDETPVWGSLRFGKSGTDIDARLYNYQNWLGGMVGKYDVDIVCFEAARVGHFGGKTTQQTIELLIGLTTITRVFFYPRRNEIDLAYANVSDVRNHFIGCNPKRLIAKPMVEAKCAQMGWETDNDNEADALAIWSYMRSIIRPEMALAVTGGLFKTQTIVKPKPRPASGPHK